MDAESSIPIWNEHLPPVPRNSQHYLLNTGFTISNNFSQLDTKLFISTRSMVDQYRCKPHPRLHGQRGEQQQLLLNKKQGQGSDRFTESGQGSDRLIGWTRGHRLIESGHGSQWPQAYWEWTREPRAYWVDKGAIGLLSMDKRAIGLLRVDKAAIGLLKVDKGAIGLLRVDKGAICFLRLDKGAIGYKGWKTCLHCQTCLLTIMWSDLFHQCSLQLHLDNHCYSTIITVLITFHCSYSGSDGKKL